MIRVLFVFTLLFNMTLTSAYPLVVLQDNGNTVPYELSKPMMDKADLKQYLANIRAKFSEANGKPISHDKLFDNNYNEFKTGPVTSHPIKLPQEFNTPIFIIDTSDASKEWLSQHQDDLKRIHAIGVISGKQTKKHIDTIYQTTGLTVIPANLNGLSQVVGTSHLPLLIHKRWVLQ